MKQPDDRRLATFSFAAIKRPEERFERTSPSNLSTLAQCPRAYAIGRDYKRAKKAHKDLAPDAPNYKMRYGTSFHKAVEVPDSDIDDIVAAQCADIPDSGWDAKYRTHEDVALGVRNALKAFNESELSKPWRKRTKKTLVEKEMSATINGMPMKGVVDMITNKGEVVDLKTTSKSFRTWHGDQLTAYWLLAKENGVKVKDDARVIKIYRPRNPKASVEIEDETINVAVQEKRVRKLMDKAIWLRDNQATWQDDYTQIENNPNAAKCNYCVARGTSACPETRTW